MILWIIVKTHLALVFFKLLYLLILIIAPLYIWKIFGNLFERNIWKLNIIYIGKTLNECNNNEKKFENIN
jgi:hypothetical protein